MNDFRLRDCQIGKWGCSIQGSIAIQLILTTDCTFCRLCGLPLEVTVKREQRRWRWTPQIRKTSHSVELTKIYYHNTLLTKSSWKQLIREVTINSRFHEIFCRMRENCLNSTLCKREKVAGNVIGILLSSRKWNKSLWIEWCKCRKYVLLDFESFS